MHVHSRLTRIAGGVYCDTAPEATPDNADIEAHYADDALTILRNDRRHYDGLREVLRHSVVDKRYGNVADLAGGHPKLASLLDCDEITVYDRQARTYEANHGAFAELYEPPRVTYEESDLLDDANEYAGDLVVMCHILEHLPVDSLYPLLRRCNAPNLLIYGPNIEAARNEGWFHYAPKDHITFLTLPSMCGLVTAAGWSVTMAKSYSDDYIVYGEKL